MPQVAIGTTGDVRMLADAAGQMSATDNPTQLAEAVELARRLLGREGKQEIIVLTDGADAASAKPLEKPT